MRILSYLKPDAVVDSLWDVSLDQMKSRGIKGLLVDLDNTLVEYRKYVSTPRVREWLKSVERAGLGICIVSNSRRRKKVAEFSQQVGVPAISRAGKPRRGSFRKALSMLGLAPEETAIIGDQLLTDILGGNRLGCYTVLVMPITRQEFLGTRIVRILERRILKLLVGPE